MREKTWSLFGSRSTPPSKRSTEVKQEHYITTANDTRMIAVAARRQQEHKSDTPQGSVNKVPLDRHHALRFGLDTLQ